MGLFQYGKKNKHHSFLDPFQVFRAVRFKSQVPGYRSVGTKVVVKQAVQAFQKSHQCLTVEKQDIGFFDVFPDADKQDHEMIVTRYALCVLPGNILCDEAEGFRMALVISDEAVQVEREPRPKTKPWQFL